MSETNHVIEVKNLTKDYGDFKLNSISFEVPQGCICGFIGQNGAGKTTTIQLILDVIKADDGEIKVFGETMSDKAKNLKENIGVVYDEMGFHDFMTGVQINKMMKNIYANWDDEQFFGYMKRFELPTKKKCSAFSRGMRMKLQIAVAMSHHAKLLIMDEPTSGLDPIVRNEIVEIFQEYVCDETHTILLSSHILSDLERIADELIFINGGQIVLAGNKDKILETRGLIKCKKSDLECIDAKDIVSVRSSQFGVEVMVEDKEKCRRKYPELFMESASLEEIMIFYVNRANAKK